MNKIMQKVLSIVLAMLMCITSLPLFAAADEARQPREWFVSLDGNDSTGIGTIDKPFRTLQKGADMLQAGDTLYIRGGVYDEFFKVNASGTAEAPITIKNYNDEEVTVRATTTLTNWGKAGDNIWVTDMTFDKEKGGWRHDGLFIGDRSLILARYPNIPEGGSIMWPEQLVMDDADRHSTEVREMGTIWDAELTQEDGYWDGAQVHMQAGLNWYNVIATVESYEKGILHLVDHNFNTSAYYDEAKGNPYYIKNHINALDTTDEYYIDYEEKKVYIYYEGNPNNVEIGARNALYAFDVSDVSYIDIVGLNVRGAPPKLSENSSYVNFEWMSIGGLDNRFNMYGHHNTIKHSHLFDSPYDILCVFGRYNAIFNCEIENLGWMGSEYPGVSVDTSALNAYVGYNTIHNAGRSTLGAGGVNSIYEFNHLYNAGSLTHDTGISYDTFKSCGTSEFRYNWLHDMTAGKTAFGFYYDRAVDNVAVHHNVVWDNDNVTGELLMDGWVAIILNDPAEGFSIYNNTFIGDFHQSKALGLAGDTRIVNNIFTGEIQGVVQHKMQRNNILGWLEPGFVDARNYDFTLREDSVAIDAGVEIEGVTEGYVGSAPDIGAYEYGGEYWVPGHNWENPPEFVHRTPNYVQYHNQVTQSSFEDDQDFAPSDADKTRMWDPSYYGWSIMEDSQGTVDQEFFNQTHVYQAVRRGGLKGVKLGEDLPTAYPGDEAATLSSNIINVYNDLKLGLVNYPEWRKRDLYNRVPEAFYSLLVDSANLMPQGDFEDGVYVTSTETCEVANTDEEAYSGSRSLKAYNMKYAWAGPVHALPATGHRKFRVSLRIKGDEGATFKHEFVNRSPSDWTGVTKRSLYLHNALLTGDWDLVSFDVDTKGTTDGIRVQMTYSAYNGGEYYIDDYKILDITELYLMQDACSSNAKARAIIDAAIDNKELTAEQLATAMKEAARIMMEENRDAAIDILLPILTTLRNNKLSPDVGITYTVDTLKAGRTYKLTCHAWLTNPNDKVQYTVKDGDKVLAEWETNSQKWTEEFVTFVAPESGKATIEIWKPLGIGSAHIDDVNVREYDPIVYKARKSSKYIENNDMEYGEVWPWYSIDGELELVSTDRGTSLKVENGRAMQDFTSLPNRKTYRVFADLKLNMPGVASKEAEVYVHAIEGTSNGTYLTFPIGKAKITNNEWTHFEGIVDCPEELRYDSIGFTAGLVGGEGCFLLDDVDVKEMPKPTTPGTGDGMTFEKILADTKKWSSTSGDQGLAQDKTYISTTNGVIGYIGETFRDFRFTFDMKIDGFTSANYPTLTVRNDNDARSYASGYTFVIYDTNIELQKYGTGVSQPYMYVGTEDNPEGAYGPSKWTTAFKMGEWNRVTVGTTNEADGVRIYLEVNGEVIYDVLDTQGSLQNAGYICFGRNGATSISVRAVNE